MASKSRSLCQTGTPLSIVDGGNEAIGGGADRVSAASAQFGFGGIGLLLETVLFRAGGGAEEARSGKLPFLHRIVWRNLEQ